jgi:hypothetical protein
VLLLNGIRSYGGSPLTLMGQHWHHLMADSMMYLPAHSGGFGKTTSIPRGYYDAGVIALPVTAGQMSSFKRVNGSGEVTAATLWAVKLAQASITGTGELTAIGGLIVQALAALTGSGTVSDANLQAFLAAVANLTGSGTVSDADLEGLGALLAAVIGSGTLAGSTLTGIGELDADLVVTGTGLSTSNVGQAVWSAVAAVNNSVGTMGEKLNDAGSASNPWTEVIESGYTAAEILRILASVAAGKTVVVDNGDGTATVTFRDIGDNKNRIVANMTGSDRTSLSLDET